MCILPKLSCLFRRQHSINFVHHFPVCNRDRKVKFCCARYRLCGGHRNRVGDPRTPRGAQGRRGLAWGDRRLLATTRARCTPENPRCPNTLYCLVLLGSALEILARATVSQLAPCVPIGNIKNSLKPLPRHLVITDRSIQSRQVQPIQGGALSVPLSDPGL